MANWLESQLGQTAILSLQQDGINIPPEELQNAQDAVTSAMRSAHMTLPQTDGYQQPTTQPAGTL